MKPLGLAALLLPLAAHAATPVGTWTGRFVPQVPVLPPNAPASARAKLASDLALIKTGRMHLTVKPDHTYAMRIVGLPMLGNGTTTGTWKQKGAFVDMVEAGKPKGTIPVHLALSERKMLLAMAHAQFVFTR